MSERRSVRAAGSGDAAPSTSERISRARAVLECRGLDALLVSEPHDVRYLSGFRGEDAWLLLGRHMALICTDSRFWGQVAEEVTGFTLEKTQRLIEDVLAAAARELGERAALGFQGSDLTHATYRHLRRLHRGRLRDVGEQVSALRSRKDAAEIATIRRACQVVEAAVDEVLAGGLSGRSEAAVSWDLRAAMHGRGAEDLAFESIVAAGERGALAHAIPGQHVIRPGDLVVIDVGARVDGYCSDLTRTVAVGVCDARAAEVYGIVLAAQRAGLAAVRAGVKGTVVDAAARRVITDAGYGEAFGHGTGHGVGLAVHEGPRLGRTAGDRLEEGMVCTVEPGIYLEGAYGVRIEDTVLVTPDGCERLTTSSTELRVVD